MPNPVLLQELPNILPMLLQSTKVDIPSFSTTPGAETPHMESPEKVALRVSTVNMFIMLSQEVPDTIVEHLGTLLPRLLQMATNFFFPLVSYLFQCHDIIILPRYCNLINSNFQNLRKAALVCLSVFAHKFPYVRLVPYKEEVLRKLKQSLDDKKRVVRRQAVKTRNLWYIIGFAPKETA